VDRRIIEYLETRLSLQRAFPSGITRLPNEYLSHSMTVIECGRTGDLIAPRFPAERRAIIGHYVINEHIVARLNALRVRAHPCCDIYVHMHSCILCTRCQATTRDYGTPILFTPSRSSARVELILAFVLSSSFFIFIFTIRYNLIFL